MRFSSRRTFLRSAAAASAAMAWPFGVGRTMAQESKSPNSRPRVGCIGLGGMGRGDASAAKQYGDPEQAWRIADAHRVLDQDVLTEVAGVALRFTLPAGLVGVPGG